MFAGKAKIQPQPSTRPSSSKNPGYIGAAVDTLEPHLNSLSETAKLAQIRPCGGEMCPNDGRPVSCTSAGAAKIQPPPSSRSSSSKPKSVGAAVDTLELHLNSLSETAKLAQIRPCGGEMCPNDRRPASCVRRKGEDPASAFVQILFFET